MAEDDEIKDKIKDLEKRIERLESKNKNTGRIIFVSAFGTLGVLVILTSLFNLAFFANKLLSVGLLSFGVILLTVVLYFRQKWGIKGILDKKD